MSSISRRNRATRLKGGSLSSSSSPAAEAAEFVVESDVPDLDVSVAGTELIGGGKASD